MTFNNRYFTPEELERCRQSNQASEENTEAYEVAYEIGYIAGQASQQSQLKTVTAQLDIAVEGLKSARNRLLIGLYYSTDGYNNNDCKREIEETLAEIKDEGAGDE